MPKSDYDIFKEGKIRGRKELLTEIKGKIEEMLHEAIKVTENG